MTKTILVILFSLLTIPANAAILGERSVLVILMKKDINSSFPSIAEAEHSVGVANWLLWKGSNNQAWLNPTILAPATVNYGVCNLSNLITFGFSVANSQGKNPNLFKHVAFVVAADACPFIATSTSNGPYSFYNGNMLFAHEFGHNYGFGHSYGFLNGVLSGEHAFCIMRPSNGYGDYNIAFQYQAEWSSSSQPIINVTSTSSYQLSDLENPSFNGNPKGLRIVKSPTETLWVESRYGLIQVLLQIGSYVGMIDMSPWTPGNWHDGSLIRGWGYYDTTQPILIYFDFNGIVHIIWY